MQNTTTAKKHNENEEIILSGAPDCERAALGIMLMDGIPAGIEQRMPPTAMHSAAHTMIYRAMLHLRDQGQGLDTILVSEELRARGELDAAGGPAYVAMLTDGVSRSDLESHVDRIMETDRRRRIQAAAIRVEDAIQKGGTADYAAGLLREAIEATAPKAAGPETTIRAVCMADVRALPVDWLWRGRIALHALTIIEGIEGVGKSTLLTALAAAVTNGNALPEDEKRPPQAVLWLSAEDDLPRVLKPRLEAAGADCLRVHAVGEPFRFDAAGILALRELVAEHQPRLVIIDPIFAYTQGDASKGNDARALTGQLKMIAEQFDCAIVLVRHIGKSKGLGDPRAAGLYSIEWRAAARSVLLVGADPDNPSKCAIAQTKNNLGPKADSLGYEITPDAESPSGARFWWAGTSDLTAERMLAQIGNLDEAQDRNDAVDFLRELLSGGPVEAGEVEKARRRCSISDYALKKAKVVLAIKPRKIGGRFGTEAQKWEWALPAEDGEKPEDGEKSPEDGDTFRNRHLLTNHSDKSSYVNNLAEDGENKNNRHLLAKSPSSGERVRGAL